MRPVDTRVHKSSSLEACPGGICFVKYLEACPGGICYPTASGELNPCSGLCMVTCDDSIDPVDCGISSLKACPVCICAIKYLKVEGV